MYRLAPGAPGCRPTYPSLLLSPALAEFSERPDSFYGVVEGESLTVRCNSTSGRFFLWEKDGREIDETDSFVPDLTVGEGWLTISRANRSHHSGQYLCRITELDSNPLISKFNISVYCESVSCGGCSSVCIEGRPGGGHAFSDIDQPTTSAHTAGHTC